MRSTKILFILIIFFSILIFRFYVFFSNQIQIQNNQQIEFQFTLTSEPTFSKYQSLSAKPSTIDSKNNSQTIFITTQRFPRFQYGDSLRVKGNIQTRQAGTGKNSRIILTLFFPKVEKVIPQNPFQKQLALVYSLRQNIISFVAKTLQPPSSGLLLGIVFGIKQDMSKDFLKQIQQTGVTHVIAASGMNVTMVAAFFSTIFAYFFKRQAALIISIFAILFYCALSGFEPSILRAMIMALFAFSAQIFGRMALALYSLVIAAYIMLLFSPALISNVGFELSFASTLGLLYIRPLFEHNEKIKTILEKSFIGQELTTTIAAQLATLPILFAAFGNYSIWSVVVNGLVLWTVEIIMILGGIGVLVGLVIPFLGKLFLYLSLPFLLYFEKVVEFFSNSQNGLVTVQFPFTILIGYYLLLIAVVILLRKKTIT